MVDGREMETMETKKHSTALSYNTKDALPRLKVMHMFCISVVEQRERRVETRCFTLSYLKNAVRFDPRDGDVYQLYGSFQTNPETCIISAMEYV